MRNNNVGGYWIRDYQRLIKGFLPRAEIKLTKIKKPFWIEEPWGDLGYVIEVDLANIN